MNIEIKPDTLGIPTLFVDNTPFFIRGGEIHNSSASSPDYMNSHVWPSIQEMHINTLIIPIYWELIEPEEGRYQMVTVESIIDQARSYGIKIVFLWFGLWKNSESMYIPGWMKKDSQYFRVRTIHGEPLNIISPFCKKAIAKDAQAFSKVMSFIKEKDSEHGTVIMMQVENEIGILGSDSDYSDEAQHLFNQDIPEDIQKLYSVTGNWTKAFAENAQEMFMAYYYASAVCEISRAGQEQYNLPCYANAWLKQYPWYPGSYPCGGPIRETHAVWKLKAPNLFTLAPDIYVPYVADVMHEYSYEGNPLFIPEVRKDAVTTSYCLYAFGKFNAIGFAPFGIEDLILSPNDIEKPPMEVMLALNIDPSAFDITNSRMYLSAAYELLESMEPLYLSYRGTNHLQSYLKQSETDFGTFLTFEHFDLSIAYAPKSPSKPVAAGIIIELEPHRFFVAGVMSSLSFRSKPGQKMKTEILRLEEGTLMNGTWRPGRTLNGDEKIRLNLGDMPTCYMIELFSY